MSTVIEIGVFNPIVHNFVFFMSIGLPKAIPLHMFFTISFV